MFITGITYNSDKLQTAKLFNNRELFKWMWHIYNIENHYVAIKYYDFKDVKIYFKVRQTCIWIPIRTIYLAL